MNIKMLIGILAVSALSFVAVYTLTNREKGAGQEENSTVEEVSEVSLPGDLPANVPLYPGAVVKNVQEVSEEGVQNITLTLETPDSVADVNTWYRGALSAGGWAVTSDQNVGGYTLLKGESNNVAVFTQAANRSDLGVTVITERIQIK